MTADQVLADLSAWKEEMRRLEADAKKLDRGMHKINLEHKKQRLQYLAAF